jgi:hypothetical protein
MDILAKNDATSSNDRGGVLDALVNYWLMKIRYDEAPSSDVGNLVPEYNLEVGAVEALGQYLHDHEHTFESLEPSIAFDLGLELAGHRLARTIERRRENPRGGPARPRGV